MRFAERYGFRPAKEVIQLNDMDNALRNRLWNLLTSEILHDKHIDLTQSSSMRKIVTIIWGSYFKLPTDTIGIFWGGGSKHDPRNIIRNWFYNSPWHDVYDFVEFCVEDLVFDPKRKDEFENQCNIILESELSGFRMIGCKFLKITSEIELDAVDSAQAATGRFEPVAIHIRSSLGHLARRADPDYRNSIKEAISAVEAACCIITGNANASLGLALKQMERDGFQLHSAQKDAFNKLYGYTSDADGIRHALLEEESLTYEDAQFMLITCSAFINYLMAMAKP
jgi:hypothetical protein